MFAPASSKVPRRTIWAWALYDWAAQPFFTVVLTFIFGPYFQNFVAPSAAQGQAWWGYGSAAAGLAVALTAPFFGAFVDQSGQRRRWLIVSMALMTLGLSVTWAAEPGAAHLAVLILGGVVIATLGAEYGILITNAMMTDLVDEENIGKLSGFGWAIGYLGGLALLVFVMLAFVFPDQAAFGLDKAAHEPDRIVGPLSILWLWVFTLPLLFLMPARSTAIQQDQGSAFSALRAVMRRWRQFKNILLFMVARMLYYDGVTAVYLFGGLYAAGTLGWDITQLGIFGLVLILAGAAGTLIGGRLDDALGSKRTIILSLLGIIAAVLGILSIEPGRILFVVPVEMHRPGDGFGSIPAAAMLAFGVGVGLFLGPVQSASRTMMARIAPTQEMNTFFGLYALTGRATAFVAPLVVAILTSATGSRRIGIAAIVVLLLAGLALLMRVKEERSRARFT
ncbi:MAG: MFS transporter [Pseudomonadota bacterium]